MSDLAEFEACGHRWWTDPAHEAFVRDTLAPLAAHPEELPGAEVIKSNRVRTVARADGPAGKLFVKRFRVLSTSSRLLHTVKPSPARREWDGMRSFAKAGVACPRPVILGEERRGGLLRGSVLATLEVADAPELASEIKRLRAEGEVPQRKAMIEALARSAWEIFKIGANHPDMHSGNFLIGADGECVALDLHSLLWVRGGLLGVGLRRRRLARIAHSLSPRLEEGKQEVAWLAASYAQLDPALGSAEALERVLLDRSDRLEAVRLASRGKRCLVESTTFAVETVGAKRIYRRREVSQEAVLAALDAESVHVLHAHPKGRSRLDIINAPEGFPGVTRLIRKNYLFGGLRRRVAGLVNPAPLRNWKAARACELREVQTPKAWAMVLEGGALPSYGAVLLELIDDASMIHVLLTQEPPLSPRSRRRLATDFGHFMGHFHVSGLEHHDLAVQNILVRPKDGDGADGWDIWVIDLDEVSVGDMSRKAKLRALTQLGDLPAQATRSDRCRFWQAYLAAGGERVLAKELEEWGARGLGQRVGALLEEKAARKARRMARKAKRPKPTDLGPLQSA